MQNILRTQFTHILNSLLGEKFDTSLITFSQPPKKELGDITLALFPFSKLLQRSPQDIGESIIAIWKQKNDEKTFIVGMKCVGGYLNIFLDPQYFTLLFSDFFEKKEYFPQKDISGLGDTIYIDYIGANVGKPLHIGHMCTPLQGQFFINLFQKLGYHVVSDSHIGDWGIIFGKLIVAYKTYGNEKKLSENAVEHLFELYVKISDDLEKKPELESEFRAAFQKLSEGVPEYVALWKKFTSSSIESMEIQLFRLGVKSDYNIGESFYEGIGLPKLEDYPDLTHSMKDIVEELVEKGIATKNDDNSVGIVFSEESKLPSCILQKRDGTHGYLASDLAAVKYRSENWKLKKIVYFVDLRQQLHFKQVESISRAAGWIDETIVFFHAYNGFISLKDGAMSTRKGRIIKLEALLDEAEERAKNIIREKRADFDLEKLEELGRKVGIGAVKYGYLKKSREHDSIFDWDEFMNFDGNSGPYIQYAYVRAKKILSQSGDTQKQDMVFTESIETEFISKLLVFPEIITETTQKYAAHILCQYIYELTKIFSSLYAQIQILTENNIQKKYSWLMLLTCFTEIIEESFLLLGIELPDEM